MHCSSFPQNIFLQVSTLLAVHFGSHGTAPQKERSWGTRICLNRASFLKCSEENTNRVRESGCVITISSWKILVFPMTCFVRYLKVTPCQEQMVFKQTTGKGSRRVHWDGGVWKSGPLSKTMVWIQQELPKGIVLERKCSKSDKKTL